MEQKIRMDLAAESRYCGCVDRDPVLKGSRKLLRHHGDILLLSVDIAERHTDKLHVILGYILHYLIFRILHFPVLPFGRIYNA